MTDHPIESEQLQPEDTLIDRGVDDVLDEGYSPAENYGPGEGFGTTVDEEREGENLEQRVAQEEPDVDPYADEELEGNVGELTDESGDTRAGRLVDPDQGLGEDTEKDLVGDDVGIDGAGASAEEAAIHVIEDE
ncbi:MAG: hypothetical protein EON52_05625 [Actinomycetales bacterium]|nr:MAG: hypothetical protein EON52_05625 [Actinomycetales bacterium]